MSDPYERSNPELGEPSQALKDEFRLVIEAALLVTYLFPTLLLPDGRTMDLMKPDDEEVQDAWGVGFAEAIPAGGGVITRHVTSYHLTLDGTMHKSTQSDEPEVPQDQVLINALLEPKRAEMAIELRNLGDEHDDTTWDNMRRLAASIRFIKRGADALTPEEEILRAVQADEEEEEQGFGTVSGVELREVIDTIREAVWPAHS